MKSQKKLSEVMNIMNMALNDITTNDDAASLRRYYKDRFQTTYNLIHEFLADNTDVKNAPLSCKEFVGHDDIRPVMNCVFHDPETQMAVATDAHVLFANPDEYIDTPTEWHLRTPYGDPTDTEGVYPKWLGVLPPEEPRNPEDRVDFNVRGDLAQVIKDCTAEAKMTNGLKAVKTGVGRIRLSEEAPIWCDLVYAGFIARAGLDGWYTVKNHDGQLTRGFVKRWDGQILLIMPVMPPDDGTLTDEEKERGWYVVSDR